MKNATTLTKTQRKRKKAKRSINPHCEKIGAALKEISPYVESSDRKEFNSENPSINKVKITRYLMGKVTDINTGLLMLSFFKKCVDDRNSKISKLTA